MEESCTLKAARGREGREKSLGSGARADCKQPNLVPHILDPQELMTPSSQLVLHGMRPGSTSPVTPVPPLSLSPSLWTEGEGGRGTEALVSSEGGVVETRVEAGGQRHWLASSLARR